MISKELLAKVFGCEVSETIEQEGITRVIDITCESDGTFLNFGYQGLESSHRRYINVHELAHMCKEWAKKEKVIIASWLGYGAIQSEFMYMGKKYAFFGDTEPEAIFKACQWMLDSKDSQ